MKEDILEQLVDGWFLRKRATFTKHNVKYKPSESTLTDMGVKQKNLYAVHSDIDVMAVHLDKTGVEKVSIVSCKSWQSGFDIDHYYKILNCSDDNYLTKRSEHDRKKFRELFDPVWSKAFRDKVFQETLCNDFTYYIAITRFKNNKSKNFENFKIDPNILKNLTDDGKHCVRIEFLTLETMLNSIFSESTNTTLEATEIGRFIQLIKAANLSLIPQGNSKQ